MNKRPRKTVIVIILLLMGIAGIAPAQFMAIAVALIAGWPFSSIWLIGVDRTIRALPETGVDPAFIHQ